MPRNPRPQKTLQELADQVTATGDAVGVKLAELAAAEEAVSDLTADLVTLQGDADVAFADLLEAVEELRTK